MSDTIITKKVDLILRWLVALIFIYAAIGKIINPAHFANDIDNYRILPYLLVTLIAILLPWVELFSGALLIIGKYRKGASLILLVLTAIFLIAISSAIIRKLDIDCGCFIVPGEMNRVGYAKLGEDIVLFILTITIFIRSVRSLPT